LWIGGALGILLVTKTVWIIVFGIWPFLWLLAFFTDKQRTIRSFMHQASKLFVAFIIAITILNAFYNFHGSFRPFKQYSFISASLTGNSQEGHRMQKNRFAET
jgi:glucan phosphoethanolaminetransferase (alkaline phosphatase superfamily)